MLIGSSLTFQISSNNVLHHWATMLGRILISRSGNKKTKKTAFIAMLKPKTNVRPVKTMPTCWSV